MCMHSVRNAQKFTTDFLLQYLFSLCDKLLSKRGWGKCEDMVICSDSQKKKLLVNHIRYPAGSKQ